MTEIVESNETVVLIGGGEAPLADLSLAMEGGRKLVAADGAAAIALALGLMPEAVIGDMDSLDPALVSRLDDGVLHPIPEQDSTDFDKCLRSIRAPLVIGVGFLGRRLDHQMAAQSTLAARADRRCLLLGAEDVVFLCPPELALDLPHGMRFSLFPMGPVAGRSEGLEWPIDGLDFTPAGRVGTSNRVTGPVRLRVDAPLMLVILPRAALDEVVRSLAAQPATWPAP